MPIFPHAGSRAARPHDPAALRGARRRARELGVLDEFREFVSDEDIPTAMDWLALQELLEKERARRRRAAVLSTIAVVATCAAVYWSLVTRGA
jgi:hypothetical protein